MSKLRQLAMEYLPKGKTTETLIKDKQVIQELVSEMEAELHLRHWGYVSTGELQTTKK